MKVNVALEDGQTAQRELKRDGQVTIHNLRNPGGKLVHLQLSFTNRREIDVRVVEGPGPALQGDVLFPPLVVFDDMLADLEACAEVIDSATPFGVELRQKIERYKADLTLDDTPSELTTSDGRASLTD